MATRTNILRWPGCCSADGALGVRGVGLPTPEHWKHPRFLVLVFIVVGLVLAARPPADQVQGMVEAETFTVATKAPSRVEQLLASEGQQVAAGEVLAVLSSPEIEAKDAQARALLQSAQAVQSMSREGARPEDVRSVESVWRSTQAAARPRKRS